MARINGLVVALCILAANIATTAAHASDDHGPGGTAPVRPFRLDQVQLGNGLLQEKRDRMKEFVREYDERRFLVLFNNQAGRNNPSRVNVPGGWEDGGLLSGHWAGHYMTALSQAYADQGEDVYKTKLDWMVKELAACQDAITARIRNKTEKIDKRDVSRVSGKFNSALQLGSDDAQYITLPQETINQLRDFTIATWVKISSNQTWARLFDFGRDTTTNMFLTTSIGSAPRFAITTGGAGEEQQINGNAPLPMGKWVHVAVTLSGSTGTLYVDGKEAGKNTKLTLNPASLNSPGNRWIGRSQYGDDLLDAILDEFHIFNRALTAAEIMSLQTSASGSTSGGNIAWYRFDEEDGTSVRDASPNGRNAGIVGKEDAGTGLWAPTHPGYLGALPEDTVLRLGPPRWAVYGGDANTNTWAPWYTQHKIIRGLLDAYYNTNNSQALDVVVKMANWAHLALTVGDKNQPGYKGNLTRSDLNYMWDLYIAGEFGGANEVFPEIYQLTGGDARHLVTAKAFDNRESLFGAAVQNNDILVVPADKIPGRRRAQRLHANTHVPQFLGYMSVFEHGGGQEYFDAAKNFYGWVVPHRHFVHGGTGGNYPGANDNAELFQNRDNVANAIASNGAETCTTYNMIKLARYLFMHEHNATYMDNYERGLFNMIAGSRADQSSTSDPLLTYFQPLTPGSAREFGNTGTCCGGTGMESHTKYQETVYLRSADGSTLYVNLYVPSSLNWADKGFAIKQVTQFPRNDTVQFTVTKGSGALDINLRVPAWVRKGFEVTVNGKAVANSTTAPSSYLTISRTWTTGDTITLRMPFTMRVERTLDRPDTQALMWGPIVIQLLGTPSGSDKYHHLSLYRYLRLDGDYARVALTQISTSKAGDPTFSVAGAKLTARPYYISDTQSVSSYFRRDEPTIIFGTSTTKIANRKRNDGLPRYDVPIQNITSPGSDGPTFLDVVWDAAPFASLDGFAQQVGTTVKEFVEKKVYSQTEGDQIVAAAKKWDGESV